MYAYPKVPEMKASKGSSNGIHNLAEYINDTNSELECSVSSGKL
jgi:hypothetical protein